ncbi:hypothetical protein K432DRAFT_457225, partial [Lepidopterella palustris CBS 459.81]
ANNQAPAYRNGIINLETEEVKVDTELGVEHRCFNILDLGETEILLGWDWLTKHNPIVD